MLTQLKFKFQNFYCMLFLFIFVLGWNAVVYSWYECTLPIFVLGDYILLSFSCTVHKPTIFWPNSCISYVLTYILFFLFPTYFFFFCIAVSPSPFHPFPFVFNFPFLVFAQIPMPLPVLPFSPRLCLCSLSSFPVFMLLCLNKMFLGPTCPN